MARLTTTIMAVLLVLTMWAGVSAHAADRVDVVPAEAALGHFDGDSDQVPADEHEGVAHHHAPCGDQHAAAMNNDSLLQASDAAHARLAPERFSTVLSRVPDADLRPPIA